MEENIMNVEETMVDEAVETEFDEYEDVESRRFRKLGKLVVGGVVAGGTAAAGYVVAKKTKLADKISEKREQKKIEKATKILEDRDYKVEAPVVSETEPDVPEEE